MSRFLLALAGSFALVLVADAEPEDFAQQAFRVMREAQDKDSEKAIRAVLDAQQTAWNKGDLDGFMTGYWKDDKLVFISGAKSLEGWKALKERYEKAYQGEGKEMGKLKFTELNVEMLGVNVALVRGKWDVAAKESATGWFTLIFKKQADGSWKITHDHTSK